MAFANANQVKSADYNTGEFSPLHNEIANYEDSDYTTNIKPQYKGKLIYAQSGTGKSTIADNKTVFDSDYILGDILGVSPETAGFFFGTLSSKQKKAFGEQYRQAIKDKVAQGYTVLTANASLLNDADVVVYNSTPEQTEERVNRGDRALNNRYHAISYHQDTLSDIKELEKNDKNKEYIELDNGHYLGDYILSNMGTLSSVSDNQNQTKPLFRTRGRGHRATELEKDQLISDFLNEFGITVNLLNDYDGELPLFDALNRVINAKNASEITDGVGYAIAFMMQGDPEMQKFIVSSHLGLKGDLNRRVWIPFKGKRSLKNLHTNNSPISKEVVAEVGRQIAEELRNNFGTPIEKIESGNKVWNIIKNFFKKIGMSAAAFGKRRKVKENEKLFVKDIIEALGREDFSRIKGPRIKEGSLEKANRVDIETALKENPFEDNIIRKLGEHGIALAGSTSIALEGALYRPSENPLHDIDFNAGDNSSKESLSKLLPTLFPKDTIYYASEILKHGEGCVTFVTLDTPFEVRNRDKRGWHAEYYSKDGKYLGRKEGSELYIENGVKGKLLDFFVGKTQESNYGFYKRNINGHDYLLSHSEAAMNAKITWKRPKDMWDYKNFKKDDFTETTKEFLQSLSEDEVKKELSLMKQEENDYDTLFAIEPSQKKTERTGPQDFTFADGTTLRVPFKPNNQQVAALNAMDEFIQNKDEYAMTLSGYAGTGKTSLMEIIARKANLDGNRVAFVASTNKAASVLDSKVSKLGYKAVTFNKLFGIAVEADTKSKVYDASKLKLSLKENNIKWGTTVIIDEASMINKENYDIINSIAQMQGLKIIYVGDAAQLPPVKSEEISPVFKNKNGKVVTLTQVERTDDNAILKEATAIRNGKSLSGVSSFNAKGEGVAYISANNKEAVDDIINHYVPELKNNPNYFRILAFTNKAVAEYNEKVRKALGYDSPVPRVGEAMMGYKNWGYNPVTHGFDFINSESYRVIAAKKPVRISRRTQDGHTLYMEAVPLTLEDSLGNRVKVNYMDVKNNPANREVACILADEKTVLWQMWHQTHSKNVKAKIDDIDKFLFINDTLISKDGSKRVLQEKVVDFGYALTTHKSQGSTFTHVLLDDVDIAKHTKSKSSMDNSVDLFGNTEETVEDYNNAEMTSDSGDMGLFDDMDLSDSSEGKNESKQVSQPNVSQNQEVNLRQMLEYVGVSRATDTVSVISNNVKKEDSPLNHLANVSTMSTKELVKKIQSDSQKMSLTSDEKYYTDENGNKFARVTSVITTEEDRFDPNSPWAVPSSAVGTGVDIFFRDFFDGEIGNPNTLAERYPNADQEHLRALYDKLQTIKDSIKGRFTVVPKDVTLKGQVVVSDKNGKKYSVNVAGTVDLLIHDNDGNFFIYDMKTHHSKEPIDHNPTKLARYTKQVSLYKALFEQQYPGHPVKSLALLPIHVEYPNPKGFGNGTAEYTSDKNTNQLYLNGSEFRGANPVLEKTIQVTPQEVTVRYEDLSDEAKAIATPVDDTINHPSQRSEETKPVDWRETLNQEFDHLRKMGINVFLHEGMQRFFEENPNKFVQMARAFSGSQLTFARNIKKPKGVDNYLLSSAIMTQANTFEHIKEDLQNNIGSVAKRVIFFGNNAYLWSTENGYEFFVEDSLPINEKNYNTLNDWIDTYGTDAYTLGIIRAIQTLGNEKARMRRYIESARRRGVELRSAANNRIDGLKRMAVSNSTGNNGNPVANTKGQEEFGPVAIKRNDATGRIAFSENSQTVDTDDLAFFIGKKARSKFEQSLRKARLDMTDREIQSTLDFLHSLENNKENTAYIKTAITWVANRSITLPQDNVVARQAFDAARKHHVDIQKYRTLAELLNAPEMKPKEKEKVSVDPDEQKTFSNKRTVTTEGGRVFTVYDVENSEEGQKAVCKILASHYKFSPWCLSTFTSKGEPTESAKRYWKHYDAIPRKIAFENGKPVAFSSNSERNRDKLMLEDVEVYKNSDGEYLILTDEDGRYPYMDNVPEGYIQYNNKTWRNEVTKEGIKHIIKVKAVSQDAWWDMNDKEPRQLLDDNIANSKEDRSVEEQQEIMDWYENEHPDNEITDPFELPFFLTPRGEVYGFVDKDNNVYFDETKISPEHPVHEYTHIWDRVIASKNSKLWQRGVELMRQTPLWQEILNDENYGKRWQAIKGMSQSQLESLIASEVHARLSGKKGMALIEEMAKKEGQKGIIGKLKQWLLDMWKELKKTFSPWTQEDLDNLTLEDFTNMTVRDFIEGINPMTAKDITTNNNNNETEQYRQTDEFRRVQEAVRGSGKEESSRRSVFEGYLKPDQRQRLADVLRGQLGSIDSFIHGSSRTVDNQKHRTSFKVHSEVNPKLFHDVFEVVRFYTKKCRTC